MGLNLANINQKPYVIRDGQGFVKGKQDENASKSAAQTGREEQAETQNGRSRGLDYIEQNTPKYQEIKPEQWQQLYAKTYVPAQKQPQSAELSAVSNYSQTRSSKINIAQILKDFNNTAIAIGTPDNLKEEVDGYLNLIQTQIQKENPNVKLIKSNLKNASSILDNYITETLGKNSKVVENWVDALFLQQIDFKYNENDINPQFLVKFPQNSTETQKTVEKETAEEISQLPEQKVEKNEQTQEQVKIPQDKELKSLFIRSKKFAYTNEPKKAIETFQKALVRAEEIGDIETKSKIYYEVGQIYDDYNHLPQALKSFDLSVKNTTDSNIKTKAHYSMAQIYDDKNQIEPALDHYFVSAAYGGESENLAAQSTSLTRIGNIFSDMYEQNAFEYFDAANEIASQTDNSKVKGFVASSTARAYERFGEPEEALKSYSDAVQNYTKANSPQKTAQGYLSAADIMIDFSSFKKAEGLLNKAKKFAAQAEDTELLNEINSRLEKLSA